MRMNGLYPPAFRVVHISSRSAAMCLLHPDARYRLVAVLRRFAPIQISEHNVATLNSSGQLLHYVEFHSPERIARDFLRGRCAWRLRWCRRLEQRFGRIGGW